MNWTTPCPKGAQAGQFWLSSRFLRVQVRPDDVSRVGNGPASVVLLKCQAAALANVYSPPRLDLSLFIFFLAPVARSALCRPNQLNWIVSNLGSSGSPACLDVEGQMPPRDTPRGHHTFALRTAAVGLSPAKLCTERPPDLSTASQLERGRLSNRRDSRIALLQGVQTKMETAAYWSCHVLNRAPAEIQPLTRIQ